MAPLPATAIPGRGIMRVVTPDQLTTAQQQTDAAANQNNSSKDDAAYEDSLVGFIQGQFSRFTRHRDSAAGWTDRLTAAMQAFKGEYDNDKLVAIKKFGGSQVYARIIASKCRGASSLLRDLYLNTEKPWGLEATPDPTLPEDVTSAIQQLVTTEVQNETRLSGQPPDADMIRDRVVSLYDAAKLAAKKKARDEADKSQDKVDDILVEGKFYEALGQFITDLPLFPFACVKGPVVKIVPSVTWVNQKAVLENTPKMFWYRVSPYDIWWTPGASNIADAEVIERSRVSRADLNQLLGLPGYNEDAVRQVLKDYGRSGYVESTGTNAEQQRANMESRESPSMNESGMMDLLEYHGYVQGQMLLDWGMTAKDGVDDPDKDFFVDCFKIGRYVIKCQVSASVKKRPPYYITSFEKVPGTVVGNALPDLLADVQDVSNACFRSLVNNMSLSSGPQIVVNDERLSPNESGDEIYPHKRWHVESDPAGNNSNQAPITFFNIPSNAQELLAVYDKMNQIADDLSAIPRYITGSSVNGGAGRTASGLAMLMGNAAKILQTVAANVDVDVIMQVISELYDMIMLTDTTGMLRGDESIKVLGVNVAVQRETERQRQLEFLQMTANPFDIQIMGAKGRADVLRSVANTIGLQGDNIVPPDDQLPSTPPGGGGGPGGPPGGPGGPGQPPGQPGQPPTGGSPAIPGTPGNAAPAPAAPQGPAINTVGNG